MDEQQISASPALLLCQAVLSWLDKGKMLFPKRYFCNEKSAQHGFIYEYLRFNKIQK